MDRSAFQSPRGLGRLVVVLLGLVLVADLANIGSNFMQLDLLDRAASGAGVDVVEANDNDARVQMLAGLQLVIFFVTGIAFLTWFHRLYKNVGALASRPTEHTPGWAVGSFFVPFLNLVRPYEIMSEAWRHNAPNEQVGRSPLVKLWWAGWICMNIVGWISNAVTKAADQSLPALDTAVKVQMLHDTLGIVAGVLAILVVQRQTDNQIARSSGDAVSEVFG